MPAASDPASYAVALPHTWRPLGVRVAASVFGLMLLTVCVVAWVGFDQETRDKFSLLQRATVMMFGLMAFACGHALARSRVQARVDSLLVVNGYRSRRFEWAEVVSVHLPIGAPWAMLDLADGTTAPAMAIQASDGARASRALRQLRAVLERAHRTAD